MTPQDVDRIVAAVWARAPWPGNADGLGASSAANNLGHASVNSRETRSGVNALSSAEAGRYSDLVGRLNGLNARLAAIEARLE